MKKIIILISMVCMTFVSLSQNVTIEGTYTSGVSAPLFTIKNITSQANTVNSELQFMMGSRYTGAIKSIASSTVSARLGLFTYSNATYSNLIERFSILDNGKIGIGTIDPNCLMDIVGGTSGGVVNLLTLRSNYISDNTGTGLKFVNSTSNSSEVGSEIISQTITSTNGKSDLIFKSHGGGGSYGALLERMRLTGYGSLLLTSNNNDANISLANSTTGSGNNFTFKSNDALTSGTDINGGFLTLSGGASEGTGYSKIIFKVAKRGTTGSTTNTPVEVFAIGGTNNNISITDASFNLYHSSPTPNDGMSSQVLGASVAAFALWGRNSCPSTNGTGYGNATANIAVSGQMESDKTYSFGLHAMVTPCTNTTPPNHSAGVYGTYTDYSEISKACGALGYKDGNGDYIGVYGDGYDYAAKFDYDILFGAGSGFDDAMYPTLDGYGYIGTSGNRFFYMYSDNFIETSNKNKKRNITYVENGLKDYIINDIKNLKPATYKYIHETDDIEKDNESKYRPNLHLGLILEESPDYIQDNQFSGIDLYSLSTLAITGVKYSIEEIEKLQAEILELKKIIVILCKMNGLTNTIKIDKKNKSDNLTPPIYGLKVSQSQKIKFQRNKSRHELKVNKK